MRRLFLVFVALLAIASSTACRRHPSNSPQQQAEDAKRALKKAQQLYAERKYEPALLQFEQAYRFGHKGVAIMGVANCQRALKHPTLAYDAYEQALAVHEAELSADDKRIAQEAMKDLAMPTGVVAVDVAEPDADVELDGRLWGKSPTKASRNLRAAPHTVKVTKAGYAPFEQTFNLAAQESKKVDVKLGAASDPNASVAPPNTGPSPSPSDLSEAERKAAARAAFIEGVDLQDKNDCPAAIGRFETAQRMFEAPTHLLHLAQCQASTGKLVEAQENYHLLDRAALGAQAPDAFKKAQTTGRAELAKLKGRIPTLKIETTPPASTLKNVVVTVNGGKIPSELVGLARPVNPGSYKIGITASGGLTAQQDVEVREGENKAVELKLSK